MQVPPPNDRLPDGIGRQPRPRPLREAVTADPLISVSPQVLARFNAKVLDPATATRVSGQPPIRPTVYVADRLIVSGVADESVRDELTAVAAELGLSIVPPLVHQERRQLLIDAARTAGHADADTMFSTVHQLQPAEGRAVAPDAWELLQAFRARVGFDSLGHQQAGLDHLLTATRHIEWTPYGPPGASVSAPVAASYGQPGWGGRQPVAWLGPEPQRNPDLGTRRPVVAVLDSGVGEHEWLPAGPDSCVRRNLVWNGVPLGLPDVLSPGAPGFEGSGVVSDPLEGVLDPYAGHGTFIAGLIRQQCPDADILSIRVMPTDGATPEHVVLETLTALAARQVAAQRDGRPEELIDVVSLSLGYYPEHDDAASAHPFLFDAIAALGRCGVAVVASAGNDATSRTMFPAAFTPYPDGLVTAVDPGCVPLISVAALNPDGTTALFSNAGDWVACAEVGAGVVSTFPHFDAAGGAAYAFDYAGNRRSTIDPDNFASGFGVWSGTSFAAPVLAGKIAQSLVSGSCGSLDDLDPKASVERGWLAVAARTPLQRFPGETP